MAKSKDLFDDATMSFGEHLEVLRVHLWRALIGVTICVIVSLFVGDKIFAVVRKPIDDALTKYGATIPETADAERPFSIWDAWDYVSGYFTREPGEEEGEGASPTGAAAEPSHDGTIEIQFNRAELARILAADDAANGKQPPPAETEPVDPESMVTLPIWSPAFAQLQTEMASVRERQNQAVTLTVQEAFFAYLKVSFVAGFVIASPWVFYQMWLFVAVGLYPHERHYVYIYLPISIGLFLGGSVFCFYAVFPFVLEFLLGFNKLLEISPQIRLSEWISFAIMLPLMFGISFQMPLVMLFLERLSIFAAKDYREKRRLAVLVIAVISMLLTPADPMSMILMMIPLVLLYELGIVMCKFTSAKSPFDAETA
jgi:sec-independent protein translocase protein TatC